MVTAQPSKSAASYVQMLGRVRRKRSRWQRLKAIAWGVVERFQYWRECKSECSCQSLFCEVCWPIEYKR